MQRVDGIADVKVSLKDGLTMLDLKPGNKVTLAQLRQIIKNNGFVSKDATVVATGTVKPVNDHNVFEVRGTGEQLTPTSNPKQAGDGWQMVVPR